MLTIDFRKVPAIVLGLALSVLAHLLWLTKSLDYALPTAALDPSLSEPFEIVEIPSEKKIKELPVVQTEGSGNREEDKDAKFFSDRNQKAQTQTRAKAVGEFKEATGEGAEKEKQAFLSRAKDMAFPPDVEDEGEHLIPPKQIENLSLRDLSVKLGEAGSNDTVSKDVEQGSRTVLSTREFRYFSYYQRIRDLLRQHWGPNVQQKLMRMWQMGKVVNADEWTTQLHILLDKTGRVQKIAKVASCGISDIDSAAVEAFEKAGPFPNPPLGLLDEDGFVRINWSFILTTESSPRVQFSAPGYNPP